MSCPNKTSPEYENYVNYIIQNQKNNNGLKNILPSFTPIITYLSQTTSSFGEYANIYVNGSNFLPNGTTVIKFGNYYLPIIYYSSFNLSFVVPANANIGNYKVSAVNIYNGNFSPPVKYTYPSNINISNSIPYSII